MPECPEDGEPFIPCKHCDARAGLCDECCECPVWPVVSNQKLCVDCQYGNAPYVCPGCYAVGEEQCAGYCPDAAIERELRGQLDLNDTEDWECLP